EALAQYHGTDDVPLHVMITPLNLAKDAGRLILDIKNQLGGSTPGVVVIDTLNRSLVGSESKDDDMSAYLAGAGMIEVAFNCLVIIIHHTGVDVSRPRGHSSLGGTADAQLRVERPKDLHVVMTTLSPH